MGADSRHLLHQLVRGGWEATTEFQFPFRISDPQRLTANADFALLELSSDLSNTYGDSLRTPEMVIDWLLDSQVSVGPASVIITHNNVVSAALMSEQPHLYLRGRLFCWF